MSRNIFVHFVFIILTLTTTANAVNGTVVMKEPGCDFFIVKTPEGFSLVQDFSGKDPERDDTLTGDYQKYGFSDVHNSTSESDIQLWVEDYALPKSEVIAKYSEKCKN